MQNKKPAPPNRTWLYIVVLVVLFLVLIIVVVKQRTPPANLLVQPTLSDNHTGNNTSLQNGVPSPNNSTAPRGTKIVTPQESATNEVAPQSENNPTTTNNTSNTTPAGSYARLGCFVDPGKICIIKKNDDIFSVLGQGPDVKFLINGVTVSPEKIVYQTSSETYSDEQMKDGKGKVLSSANKEYDSTTKTLTISIGADPSYYDNLQPTEQRLLYLSQTVRSLMAMFGETSENFVKVERVVNELGSWQPAP